MIRIDDMIEGLQDHYPEVEFVFYEVDKETLDPGRLAIGGFFYADEMGGEIEICISASSYYFEPCEEQKYDDVMCEIAATVAHEERHQYQAIRRNLLELEEYEEGHAGYLKHSDEVDAYGNVDLALFISKYGWKEAFESQFSVLADYINEFGKDSVIVKKLIKKAYLAYA